MHNETRNLCHTCAPAVASTLIPDPLHRSRYSDVVQVLRPFFALRASADLQAELIAKVLSLVWFHAAAYEWVGVLQLDEAAVAFLIVSFLDLVA